MVLFFQVDDEEPETNAEEVLTLLIAATESFDEKNDEYLKLEREYEEAKRVSYMYIQAYVLL